MIVQGGVNGGPSFVIAQVDHAAACGQLARAWGNAQFAALEPAPLIAHLVEHHDDGWHEIDAAPEVDPASGLPYHLTQTPTRLLLKTGPGAPERNAQHHALCGLLASMHTYGLYHGRYGLSDMVFIDRVAPELKPQVTAMLDNELARQQQLKRQLQMEWAGDAFLFHNYKLLQFFDTLALFVQVTSEGNRKPAVFKNVPRAMGDDVSISATPASGGTVAMSPFPFAAPVTITTRGRWLEPDATRDAAALMRDLAAAPLSEQKATIVPG